MRKRQTFTPSYLSRFLEEKKKGWSPSTSRQARPILKKFHKWLEDQQVTIGNLTRQNIETFVGTLTDASAGSASFDYYESRIRRYLAWLERHGYVKDMQLARLFPNSKLVMTDLRLPPYALEFLKDRKAAVSHETYRGYHRTLCSFHRFLDEKKFDLKGIEDFSVIEAWIEATSKESLESHSGTLSRLKSYFGWLRKRGLINTPTKNLIKKSWVRPTPVLPQPIAPEIDAIIQSYFSKSENIYHQGLLLLRFTGLKVTELIALDYDCTVFDQNGVTQLKIPAVGSNGERLVPIDAKTRKLIDNIQLRLVPTGRETRTQSMPSKLISPGNGTRVYHTYFQRALDEACKALKLEEELTVHQLRDTFAVSLLSNGMTLPTLMEILGQSNANGNSRLARALKENVCQEYFAALIRIKAMKDAA